MSMGERYHHGDLPNALRCAACEVIGERGLGNFSLREVARRAGVSHTAPAHHFGDMQGLLTSLAVEGFTQLHLALVEAEASTQDPVERLAALGATYVRLAQQHPAHTAVMFRDDLVDCDDPAMQHAGLTAYGVLERAVATLIDTEQLAVDVHDATAMCWATMQGLLVLDTNLTRLHDVRGATRVPIETTIRQFTDFIVNGLRGHSPATVAKIS